MNNLDIWEKVRVVPDTAQKTISGGRLIGKTDISPMWRIKTLTEQFGMCGVGWKYIIKQKRLENGGNDEIAAFVDIDLFVKVAGDWSEAIPGTGGSMFVAKESKGPFTSDECFKMALTDAISVSCKALGIGADVYWQADKTKYDKQSETPPKATQTPPAKTPNETPPKQGIPPTEDAFISSDEVKKLQNEIASKKEIKEIQDEKEKSAAFTKCISDLNAKYGIAKMKELRIKDLVAYRESIEWWSATALPFMLAPEA
jgi:hypothetical protein